MTDLSELSPHERAKRCRDLADEADRLARRSEGYQKAAHEASATEWRKQADELEKGPTMFEFGAPTSD